MIRNDLCPQGNQKAKTQGIISEMQPHGCGTRYRPAQDHRGTWGVGGVLSSLCLRRWEDMMCDLGFEGCVGVYQVKKKNREHFQAGVEPTLGL